MANVSSAEGSFTFDEKFYKDHKELLDKYFDECDFMGAYGIEIMGHDGASVDFSGAGRWSMEDSLPWCLSPACIADNPDVLNEHDKQMIKMYHQWLHALRESGTSIEFEYEDEEEGTQFFVHQEGTLWPKAHDNTDGIDFDVDGMVTEDLGFNDGNLINHDFECGYDMGDGEDIKFLKENDLGDWYKQQPADFRQKHSLDAVANALVELAFNDSDYNGGYLEWRFLDEDEIASLVHDALA